MKKWAEIWLGMGCTAAVFLVGLVGFAPPSEASSPVRAPIFTGPSAVPLPSAPVADAAPPPICPASQTTLRVVFGDEVQIGRAHV